METATKDYVITTVFKTNVLPVISECNTSCVFCSHRQNPRGIEIFRMPHLNMADFTEIIEFLSPNKKIIIGEAATRIIEGEPFLHKDIMEILRAVRQRYKQTSVQITTNGILINEEVISSLVEMGGMELNISINCLDPEKRKKILGLKADDGIAEKIKSLKGRLRFSGSCVFVPEFMDHSDVEQLAALLDSSGAEVFRIFIKGYTDKVAKPDDFYSSFKELSELVQALRQKYSLPIILEPSFISHLNARVEGIVKGSPAEKAGLLQGDIILKVDGCAVMSRVAAFNSAFGKANPVLKVQRGDSIEEIKLKKPRNTSPGFVVLFDIDTCIVKDIGEAVKRNGAANTLILTSQLGFQMLQCLMNKCSEEFDYSIVKVKNKFFGGNIVCAGLLMVEDIIAAVKKYIENNEKLDLILIPSIMFDFKKRDLAGRNLKEIEEELKIRVDAL